MVRKILMITTVSVMFTASAFSQKKAGHIVIDKGYTELTGKPIDLLYDTLRIYRNGDTVTVTVMDRNEKGLIYIDSSPLQKICLENRLYWKSGLCDLLYRSTDDNVTSDCITGRISANFISQQQISYLSNFDSRAYFFAGETVIVPRYDGWDSYFCDRPVEMLSLFFRYAEKHRLEDPAIKRHLLTLACSLISDNYSMGAYPDLVWSAYSYPKENDPEDFSALKAFLYGHPILGASSGDLMEAVREFSSFARQWYRDAPKENVDKYIMSGIIRMLATANTPSEGARWEEDISLYQDTATAMPEYYHALTDNPRIERLTD